ncbi:MAG: N-acylneuraminate cytidylyltransferase [Parcubacteria group bacterium Greene0714_36]|nr:MAG: N-acylneuraminate cytidylyltransferase [Parcubacteria group bacterium Greene0714_36]
MKVKDGMKDIHKRAGTLGVITARGGSKGIPGKNMYRVRGQPLIGYCIEAAAASMRPTDLAGDAVGHLPIMRHAVEWLERHEQYRPEIVGIIVPTAPLVRAADFDAAKKILVESGADSVVGVKEVPFKYHPAKAFLEQEGFLTYGAGRAMRRQDLPRAYYSAAAIYFFRTALLFREEPSLYGERVLPYLMEDDLDINTMEDMREFERRLCGAAEHEMT